MDAAQARHALYGGEVEPTLIGLTPAQELAIVMVLPESRNVTGLCSGVLVTDALVLTAKHCQFAGSPQVVFGPSADGVSVQVTPIAAFPHPNLDLLLLELPREPRLAELRPTPIAVLATELNAGWAGAAVQLAGRGLTESGDLGQTRYATERIVNLDETWVTVDGMAASGACVGDSGGPLLARARDGAARVIGVLSAGDRRCTGLDRYVRIDMASSWLGEHSALNGTSAEAGSSTESAACAFANTVVRPGLVEE